MPTATRAPEARRLAKEARLLGIEGYQNMRTSELRAAVEEAQNGSSPSKRKAPAKGSVASKAKPRTSKPAEAAQTPARPAKKAAAKRPAAKAQKATQPAKKTAAKKAAPTKASTPTKKAPAAKATSAKATGDPKNPFRPRSNVHTMTEELLKGGKRADMIKRLKKAMRINPWSKDKEDDPEHAIDKRLLLTAAALEKDHGFTIVREGRGTSGTIQAIPPGAKRTPSKKAVAKKAPAKASSKPTTSKKKAR